jgi:L-gulono-1,4-lactone dehydrogenase
MRCERRVTWTNHTRNQSAQPLRRCFPESEADVVALVQEAEAVRSTVRAVGSGHAWSDAALTGGFVIETHGIGRHFEADPGPLAEAWKDRCLVRADGGMRVRDLNEHLLRAGRGLSNMGGYDGQTIAGVISTSTHGSGLRFGPLSDAVRSLDVVASRGRRLRIEPSEGPTDPAVYGDGGGRPLVQDDRYFRAAKVGVGCLGVITSVLLEVEDAYWLTEKRWQEPWSEVREALLQGDVLRDPETRHYEVYFSPYEREGDRPCLVTTRNRTEPRASARRGDRRRTRNFRTETLGRLPGLPNLLNWLMDKRPRLTPWLLEQAIKALVDAEYTHQSHRVLNIGQANFLPAYSSEIGVPISEGRHVAAVEAIFTVAERHRQLGDVYHTSPIALRFVKESDAYLSMMHGRDTMMIELIMMTRTEGGFELLAEYEKELYALGGRPHWGQFNVMGAEVVRRMYPELDTWLEVHADLNDTGVFDGPLSRRVGFDVQSFTP